MLTIADHMFLVPERALSMDITRLQEDLAGLDFDARLLQVAPMGNVWITGSRPSSAARGSYRGVESDRNISDGGTMHWFAYLGPEPPIPEEEDREARLRSLKERQNEERLKRLEEIKAHALAAQRYKEQKEMERKQRFEDLRQREDARRLQVEERKRAINEAERDRLESILRRNQEREARIEARKRNDRSSMVFAFGSSTPRMLERTETSSTFWGHRRATSTQNITCSPAPLSRRQSERELDGAGKKRATSAGGLERSTEDAIRMSSSMYEIFGNGGISGPNTPNPNYTSLMTRSSSAHFGAPPTIPAGCTSGYVGRRRTDLMPTIPSKDLSPGNRKPFARSPGRAYSMSRLDQLAKPRRRSDLPPVAEAIAPRPLHHSQPSTVSRSMSHLAISKLGPQRPLRKSDSRSMHQLSAGGAPGAPLPPPRSTRATQLRQAKLNTSASGQIEASSRPGSALSQQSTTSMASSVNMRVRPSTTPRRPRPVSIAVTGVTAATPEKSDKTTKPPLPKSRKSSLAKSQDKLKKKPITSPSETPKSILSPTTTSNSIVESTVEDIANNLIAEIAPQPVMETVQNLMDTPLENVKSSEETTLIPAVNEELVPIQPIVSCGEEPETKSEIEETAHNGAEQDSAINQIIDIATDAISNEVVDMTASMTKSRITTEEEAKAALAERRRLAREEAERLAEMERLRVEEEYRVEMERQQREEDQQRVLIEQMKAAEQERLEEAIRETEKRAEDERMRREEENRQKVLKEEAERKAREEAERQKAERQKVLQHEEKEREARRKRVEAIMLRTRGKSNNGPQQNEENSEKLNGSESAENGHKHGKEIDAVDNIIPVETLKNANTVNVDALSTDDTLNSNNANNWQRNNQQTDLLM